MLFAPFPKGPKMVAGGRRAAAHLRIPTAITDNAPEGIADVCNLRPRRGRRSFLPWARWCSLRSNHRLPSETAPRSASIRPRIAHSRGIALRLRPDAIESLVAT